MTTTKTKNITFIPALDDDGLGWLDMGEGEIVRITMIHTFDDFGVEQDTLTLEDGREFVTQDGGSTFEEN